MICLIDKGGNAPTRFVGCWRHMILEQCFTSLAAMSSPLPGSADEVAVSAADEVAVSAADAVVVGEAESAAADEATMETSDEAGMETRVADTTVEVTTASEAVAVAVAGDVAEEVADPGTWRSWSRTRRVRTRRWPARRTRSFAQRTPCPTDSSAALNQAYIFYSIYISLIHFLYLMSLRRCSLERQAVLCLVVERWFAPSSRRAESVGLLSFSVSR
jgi:hypothetical protein